MTNLKSIQRPELPQSPLKRLDLSNFSAEHYLNFEPPVCDWLLKDSLPVGTFGVIGGPPGSGKGHFTLQLAVSLAAGESFFIWEVDRPFKVLYVTAEDSARTVHPRSKVIMSQLSSEKQNDIAINNRFLAIPVCGNLQLIDVDSNHRLQKSCNYYELENLINAFQPDLTILDTYVRWLAVSENDNVLTGAACGLLEELAFKNKTALLVTHHTAKASGGFFAKKLDELDAGLSQGSIRGASALLGAVRWACSLMPIHETLSTEQLGPTAIGKNSRTYVAAKVCKKNDGPAEKLFYLEHTENEGLFTLVNHDLENDELKNKAYEVFNEINRRQNDGEAPLAFTTFGKIFGWGNRDAQKIRDFRIYNLGLFFGEKACKGKGQILMTHNRKSQNSESSTNEVILFN